MRVINVAVVVLMVDNSVSRCLWNLVRLDCAKYSGDGLVRRVLFKAKNNLLYPIVEVCDVA